MKKNRKKRFTPASVKAVAKEILPPQVIYRLAKVKQGTKYFVREYAKNILHRYRAEPPVRVRIEPASACNLRCRHCPTGTQYRSDKVDRGIMKEDVFDRIVEELSGTESVKTACFYIGGEPLLHPKLCEMLRRIKKETYVDHTWFNTNGTLLDESICGRLAESEVDRINVSIDGRTPEENDAIRLGSRYKDVRENVYRLKRALEGRQAKVVIVNCIIPKEDELHQIGKKPDFLVKDFGESMIETSYSIKWPALDDGILRQEGLSVLEGKEAGKIPCKRYCLLPFKEINFHYNGDILMCCYDIARGYVMGNIKNQSIRDVWNGRGYRKVRRALATFGVLENLPPICRQCPNYTGGVLIQDKTNP